MATRGRLHFDGDNIYTEKELRIHKLTDDVEDKIDHIPGVVNDLGSDSETDALSAKMGKVLYDQVTSLSGTGKFLSAWDCTTGLPLTNPQEDPYTYTVGDYYVVSAIGVTNYKPHGGTFTQGVPSTAVETEAVGVNDKYYFDGAAWTRIPDTAIQVGIDSALSTTSTNAVENRVVTNALNQKQATISDLATIRSGAAAGATALQRLANISELTNNLGYQTAGDVATAIAGKADTTDLNALDGRVTTAEGKISTLETSSADYASRISSLETSSGGAASDISDLQSDVSDLQGDVNTKTFYLQSDSDLTTAQAAYDWYLAGKNPIIMHNNRVYAIKSYTMTSPGQPSGGGGDDEEELVGQEYALLFVAPGIETSGMTLGDYLINFTIVGDVVDIMIYYQQRVRVLSTGNTTSYTPSGDYNPATKKYVDDGVTSLQSDISDLQDAVAGITFPGVGVTNNSSIFNAVVSGQDSHTITFSDTANTVTKTYVDNIVGNIETLLANL